MDEVGIIYYVWFARTAGPSTWIGVPKFDPSILSFGSLFMTYGDFPGTCLARGVIGYGVLWTSGLPLPLIVTELILYIWES